MTVIRGIPPRTMSGVSRERARGRPPWSERRESVHGGASQGAKFAATPVNKPREWRYQTRPSFKRVRGPLVDVFSEAEEVLIVVDLGGFTRGEISVMRTPREYVLRASRGQQQFEEIIELPSNVDVEHAREHLVNGVLEIVLPRQRPCSSAASEGQRKRLSKNPMRRAGT